MLPQPLPTLIAAGESQTLELKSPFDRACIESPVAFANAQGGTVLLGVGDKGAVQGVSFTAEEQSGGVMATFVRQVSQSDSPSRGQSRSQSHGQSGRVAEGVSGGLAGGLTGGVSEPADLRALIHARPGLKASALVALTGQLQRTIERRLQRLKANGQIEFHGVPKTGGYHATR